MILTKYEIKILLKKLDEQIETLNNEYNSEYSELLYLRGKLLRENVELEKSTTNCESLTSL